ncbi:MAG: universal stress protein [Chloroflexi bacterium]|nr:universal stress protein [Chloroflexota bacterium]
MPELARSHGAHPAIRSLCGDTNVCGQDTGRKDRIISTILVPLEHNANAEKISAVAARYAYRLGARTLLMTVATDSSTGELMVERDWIEALAARISTAENPVDGVATSGDVVASIARTATDHSADLIVMTARRQTALGRRFRGSVTDQLQLRTAVPVLVFHDDLLDAFDETNGGPGTLVVPIDGSELSSRAIPFAHTIAAAVDASIVFVQSMLPSPYIASAQSLGGGHVLAGIGDADGDGVDRAARDARQAGLRAEGRALYGPADVSINQVANEFPGSLIVMSTHGRSGIRRVVLGSVTDKIIRSSSHPVMVIPVHAATDH